MCQIGLVVIEFCEDRLSELQSDTLRISDVVTPTLAAADVAAHLTEWALNTRVNTCPIKQGF